MRTSSCWRCCWASGAPPPRPAPASCSKRSGSTRRPTGWSRPTPEACAGAWTSPRASWSRHSSCSSPSRPPGCTRARNQVWDIIRALVAEGTTILLCTQYLDEADQLADGIAVIDRGKVIAEGTPGQLKASIGSGALRVRLLDPDQRPDAERLLAGALGSAHPEPDPAALSAPCADAHLAADAIAEISRRDQDRRLLARTADPRRGLPGPDRSSGAGARRRPGHRPAKGGSDMGTTPPNRAVGETGPEAAAVRRALSSTSRPPRPGAVSTALARWRSSSCSPSASPGSPRPSACSSLAERRPERGFHGIFPLSFLSNVFVDPETLPRGLQAFVEVTRSPTW